MCIDDDPIALLVIGSCIKKAGIANEVIKMESAENALNYFRGLQDDVNIPSLIFLDLNMPVMDGWDFLKVFTAEFPALFTKTKVVILSSSVDPDDKIMSEENNWVLKFVPKPISVEVLVEISMSYEV